MNINYSLAKLREKHPRWKGVRYIDKIVQECGEGFYPVGDGQYL